MFSTTLLASVLLATTALARPSGLSGRLARRAAGRQGQPVQLIAQPATTNVSNVEYSENWAGAVYDSYPSVSGHSAGHGGVYLMGAVGRRALSQPSRARSPSPLRAHPLVAAAVTPPLHGSASTATLATLPSSRPVLTSPSTMAPSHTMVCTANSSLDPPTDHCIAWYEWYPDYAYDFSGISFSAGDSVKLTVTASSTTSGTAVIENLTTGKTVTQDITSSSALCEENAEWIVEDYEEGDSLVPFADFGTVTFTGASATTGSGSVGPSGATLIDIEQNNEVLTSASVSGSDVTIKYV